MKSVAFITPIAKQLGIDLNAEDWTFKMLTSRGKPLPSPPKTDLEKDATIVTFGSKSEKVILVTSSDSVTNDVDIPDNTAKKLPNSELVFQILKDQMGDSVSDTKFIVRHLISQVGTVSVIRDAHGSRGIEGSDMGTWTEDDGDIWFRLLGTKNARPAIFMVTDHPAEMKCRGVIKIYTWAQISTSNPFTSMAVVLGDVVK